MDLNDEAFSKAIDGDIDGRVATVISKSKQPRKLSDKYKGKIKEELIKERERRKLVPKKLEAPKPIDVEMEEIETKTDDTKDNNKEPEHSAPEVVEVPVPANAGVLRVYLTHTRRGAT